MASESLTNWLAAMMIILWISCAYFVANCWLQLKSETYISGLIYIYLYTCDEEDVDSSWPMLLRQCYVIMGEVMKSVVLLWLPEFFSLLFGFCCRWNSTSRLIGIVVVVVIVDITTWRAAEGVRGSSSCCCCCWTEREKVVAVHENDCARDKRHSTACLSHGDDT